MTKEKMIQALREKLLEVQKTSSEDEDQKSFVKYNDGWDDGFDYAINVVREIYNSEV